MKVRSYVCWSAQSNPPCDHFMVPQLSRCIWNTAVILERIIYGVFFLCRSQLLRFSWVLPVLYKSRLSCHQTALPFMLRDFNIQEWQAHRVKCVKTPMANFLVTVKLNIVRECAQSQGRPCGLDFFPCCQLTCWQLLIYMQAEMEMAPDSHSFLALFLFFVIYLFAYICTCIPMCWFRSGKTHASGYAHFLSFFCAENE